MKGPFTILFASLLLWTSCQSPQESPEAAQTPTTTSPTPSPTPLPIREAPDMSDQLTADAAVDQIAAHLLEAEHRAQTTYALQVHHPDMSRETAYEVQLSALISEQANNKSLIGWKMGGTNTPEPDGTPDPSFAYMLGSDRLEDAQSIGPDPYVGDSVLVEAEVAFIIGADLPGPEISEDQLRGAVESVAGAVELISGRVIATPEGTAPSMNHIIAARLSHANVILGDTRVPLAGFDLANEQAVTTINGEERAAGRSNEIMNTNPFDALMWIANALPKHGHYLRAGDVVITGSLYTNPTLKPGERAVVRFSTLGRVSVSLSEAIAEAD